MFWHTSREPHGIRAWWHFGRDNGPRRCIGVELGWWHRFCHVGVDCDDDGWSLSIAFPPLVFHLSLEGFPLWQPQYTTMATWRNPPEAITLPDRRECRIAVHGWTLWIQPWAKTMEWAAGDPWWVRGVSINLPDLVLGRTRHRLDIVRERIPIAIPMPEGVYQATATFERRTWKRPRWFAKTRFYTAVDVPKGVPFAGKGENSWDCGDDGLFGYSVAGHDLEKAIAHGVETVLKRRRQYGKPSADAIREALS